MSVVNVRFLNKEIDVEEFYCRLIKDDALDIVRESIINFKPELAIKYKLTDYLSDEEIESIISSEENFTAFIEEDYFPNARFIDKACDAFPRNESAVELLLTKRPALFSLENFRKILVSESMTSIVMTKMDDLTHQMCYDLRENGLVSSIPDEKEEVAIKQYLQSLTMEELLKNNINQFICGLYLLDLNEDQKAFVLDVINRNDFKDNEYEDCQKGILELYMTKYEVPQDLLRKYLQEFSINPGDDWIVTLLKTQNINDVLPLVFDKIGNDERLLKAIKSNMSVDTRLLSKYMMEDEILTKVVSKGSNNLPFLELQIAAMR